MLKGVHLNAEVKIFQLNTSWSLKNWIYPKVQSLQRWKIDVIMAIYLIAMCTQNILQKSCTRRNGWLSDLGPLHPVGVNSLSWSQFRTTEFESPWRYAVLNGIILSYSCLIIIHEARWGRWIQKFYINMPWESQNMINCYVGQISIRENHHFIVEVK